MKGFYQEVHQFIRAHSLFSAGSRILVACSGGVDSMALLHFLKRHEKEFNIQVGAAHVDHMLRGAQSAADGELVKAFCAHQSIPFYGGSVPVPEILAKFGGNVQTICREGRYAFFDEVMQQHKYDALATAHHADDQLETVLMQMTKGTSLLGIPVSRKLQYGQLIRPFLPTDKATLYTYAEQHGIPFHEDPSNGEDTYMRNRFRRHVVPYLVTENAAVIKNIVPVTSRLQEDESLLQQLAKSHVEKHLTFTGKGYPSMSVVAFCDMPTALQRRAIPLLLSYLYDKENHTIFYKSDLIFQLLEHLHSSEGNVSIDLPEGFQFIRSYDRFTLEPTPIFQEKRIELPQGEKVYWDEQQWFYWEVLEKVEENTFSQAKEVAFFDLPKASLPLSVRYRQEGDRILLPGMEKAKRLSRLFIDEKVTRNLRNRLPVLVTKDEEVSAIPELRYGSKFTKQQTSESKYIFVVGTN